jgi:copper transport protein
MLPRKYILLVLFIIWFVSVPSPVSAHADLIWSDPAAGSVYPLDSVSQITLQFDEVLEPKFSSIEVFNSRLERKDVGDITADDTDRHFLRVGLAELEEDVYTIVWLVVSTVDGHSTSGLFTFSIGDVDPDDIQIGLLPPPSSDAATSPWEVGIRGLQFLASFFIFGALLLKSLILGPGRRNINNGDVDFWENIYASLNFLVLGALTLWLLTGFVSLAWQSQAMGRNGLIDALERGIPSQLLGTRFGMIWSLRQILALVIIYVHWRNPNSQETIKIILAVQLLGSLSFSSHNAAGALWPIIFALVDWLHLLANSAWVGGLIALTLTFIPALRLLTKDKKQEIIIPVLKRFSILAIVSVVIVATTGIASAGLHILVPEDLLETYYGWTLLLKLALVSLILFFGLASTLSLRKEWRSQRPFINHMLERWRGGIVRFIRVETFIGVMILLTTALLTALPTPSPRPLPEGRLPFNSVLREIDLPDEQLRVFLALAPNYIGWNRYLVVLQDQNRVLIPDAERVRLRFYLPEVEARTDWLISEPSPDQAGLYVVSGRELVLVGDWQIEIDIQRSGLADVRFTIDWLMEPPPAFIVDPARPRLVNFLALTSIGLCLVVLIYWVFRYFPIEVFSKNRM